MSMDDVASVNLDKGQIEILQHFLRETRVLHVSLFASEENEGDINISSMDWFKGKS